MRASRDWSRLSRRANIGDDAADRRADTADESFAHDARVHQRHYPPARHKRGYDEAFAQIAGHVIGLYAWLCLT